MALKRWVSVALPVLVAAGVGSFTAPASACTVAPCPSPVRLTSAYLPGNLVYFEVLGEQDPTGLALRTSDGEPIAASIRDIEGDRVFAPEQPIAEGTSVVLEYSTVCFGEPAQQTFEFLTTAPGAIVLDPSRLELAEQGIKAPGRADETSFVRLSHSPGGVDGNASALMVHTYTVDGVPTTLRSFASRDLIEVLVPCRPPLSTLQSDTCGNLTYAPPGVHTVEVSTHIIGAATQPEPVRLQVEVLCPDASAGEADDPSDDPESPATDPEPDASPPAIPSSNSSPIRELEGGGNSVDEPMPTVSSGDRGCALGPSGAGTGRSALLALAAALGVALARRRGTRHVREA